MGWLAPSRKGFIISVSSICWVAIDCEAGAQNCWSLEDSQFSFRLRIRNQVYQFHAVFLMAGVKKRLCFLPKTKKWTCNSSSNCYKRLVSCSWQFCYWIFARFIFCCKKGHYWGEGIKMFRGKNQVSPLPICSNCSPDFMHSLKKKFFFEWASWGTNPTNQEPHRSCDVYYGQSVNQ